ncbi:EmrB/QacA subfamily drug resistance transporter [Herbihabitans rhizosphaerae]|uniref:EmrB/QacA subfamily drug resistance transporter n=1 Tax=Herbihabitans rhizosphaerae TaxID=1872711 RepID=A0A4Q7KJH1_9PSEU|nr:MFS transporter [Herbihabitans rhizosphaerae]RZS36326.1 EmrB/QacA subfamily drug resistance transporter [Herbihabitans rhizosphaerae]
MTSIANGRSRWLAFTVLCSVQLMVIIDTSIVNIALRSIKTDLGFSDSALSWVVNAYTIAFGGLLLVSGRLGDLIGRKRMFLAGIVVFTVASTLCGLAQNQEMLIIARFVQGAGAAMAAAVVMGIVITIFREPQQLGKAIAAFSFIAAAGGSVGVLAGGLLTDSISWHWVFFINVPIGIAAVVFGIPLIESDRGLGFDKGVDLIGGALVTAGLMLGVYTIVKVTDYGWGSAHTLGLGAVSAVLLALFVVRQAMASDPLVPLRLFRSRNMSGANIVQLLLVAGMFGFNFLGALYLQLVLNYSPTVASFAFLPVALVLAVVSLGMSARLNTRYGPRNVLLVGLLFIAAALALAARAPVQADYVIDVLPMAVLLGLGAGLAMPAVMALAMSGATPQDAGLVSGVASTSGMVGGALGLAVLTAISSARTQTEVTDGVDPKSALNSGFHLAFGVSAALVVAAVIIGFFVLESTPPQQGLPGGPPPGEGEEAPEAVAGAEESSADALPEGASVDAADEVRS